MGHTVNRQKEAKKDFDYKLSLSHPDRQLLEELAIACATNPSPNATFQYAFALSKSTEPSELRYAINMLDTLVLDGKFQHQVDCMYGAATALYLLGEYDEARVRQKFIYERLKSVVESCSDHCTVVLTRTHTLFFFNEMLYGSHVVNRYYEHNQIRGLRRNCIWHASKRKRKGNVNN